MGPVRVAVFDRNESFLRALTRFLTDYPDDVTVVCASPTLTHAASRLHEHNPDLVLVGVGLPGAKALEVITEIRAARPDRGITALVLLDDGHADAARSAGADEIVLKDRIGTDLLPALGRLAQAGGAE